MHPKAGQKEDSKNHTENCKPEPTSDAVSRYNFDLDFIHHYSGCCLLCPLQATILMMGEIKLSEKGRGTPSKHVNTIATMKKF